MNEYYIACGQNGRMMVYYCPFCGGSTPKSQRPSLFAHVTTQEEQRIFALFHGIRTVADVIARFGPPDKELDFAESVRSPARNDKPERGEMFRGLLYKNLSPVADVVFNIGDNDTVRGSWNQKHLGKKLAD